MSEKRKRSKKKIVSKEKWVMFGVAVVFVLLAYLIISLMSNIKLNRDKKLKAEREAEAATEVVTHAEIQDICPSEIREYVNTYTEAIEFAGNYESYSVKDVSMSLNEGEANGYPSLTQWDSRWAYYKYGKTYLGINGSGPTSLSIVYAGITHDISWSPARVAEWCKGNGYSSTEDSGTKTTLFSEGVTAFGLDSRTIDITVEAITASFAEGRPVVCLVGPGNFTQTSQYVVLCGLWADQKVHVLDPNSPNNSVSHWDAASIVTQITGAWSIGIAG